MNLEEMGFKQDDIEQRVVDRIIQMMTETRRKSYDEYGDDEWFGDSTFARYLQEKVEAGVNAAISNLTDKYVVPKVEEIVENFVLQKTNMYGETIGEPVKFADFIAKKGTDYLFERVNEKGDKAGDRYRDDAKGTRGAWLLDKALAKHINDGMKRAVDNIDITLRASMMETVKIALSNIKFK